MEIEPKSPCKTRYRQPYAIQNEIIHKGLERYTSMESFESNVEVEIPLKVAPVLAGQLSNNSLKSHIILNSQPDDQSDP